MTTKQSASSSSGKVGAGEKLDHVPLFTQEQLRGRVLELGKQITQEHAGEQIVVIGVLKGAFIFMADLVRAIDLPLTVEFIGVSSYAGTESTGHVRITHDLSAEIRDKTVILVEDIIDSGRTIDYLLDVLRLRQPRTLKIAALLSKPEAHVMHNKIDYVGFEISKEFVIGYGLDYNQQYRQLPWLAQVKTQT